MSDFTHLQTQLAQKRAETAEAQRRLAIQREQLTNIERELVELTRSRDENDRDRTEQIDKRRAEAQSLRDQIDGARKEFAQLKGEQLKLQSAFADLADPADQLKELNDNFPILCFPLRIETRFKRVVVNGQPIEQLWVRVYPDDALVDSFEELLSESEVKSARSFWVEMWKAGGVEEQERAAWRSLVGSYGSGRAAWIVRQYAPIGPPPTKSMPEAIILTIVDSLPLAPPEVGVAHAFWESFWQADGNTEAQDAALNNLIQLVGARKADAIVKGYRPENLDQNPPKPYTRAQVNVTCVTLAFDPSQSPVAKTRSWSQAPRVRMLPDRLVLMCFNGGVEVQRVVGQIIPDTLAAGPDPSLPKAEQLQVQDGDLVVNEDLLWTVDFERAVQVGMGFKLNLTPAQAQDGFERLLVLGVRMSVDPSESQMLLERLIANHYHSKHGFSLVPQGSPTNNTEDSGAAYTWIDDADAAYDSIFQNKEAFTETNDLLERRDGEWLSYALGITTETLKQVPHAAGRDQAEARAMQAALWPATIGYFMEEMLTPIFSDNDIATTRRFFTHYVSGRGPLPAVRVGRQPYGILPTMAFSRYKPGPRTDMKTLPVSNIYLQQLYDILVKMDAEWEQLADDVAHVGQQGDPHQLLLDILGLQAGSVEYHQRYAESFAQLYNLLVMVFKGNWGIFLASWLSQRGAQLLQQLGYNNPGADVPILKKFFWGKHHLLNGPVIEDAPLSETKPLGEAPDTVNYIKWLLSVSVDQIRLQDFGNDPPPKALLYLLLRHALLLAQWDAGVRFLTAHQLVDPVIARQEPEFIHVSPPNAGTASSKFSHLYQVAPQVTGDPNMTLDEYILKSGVLDTADETSDLRAVMRALETLIDTPTARLERLFSEHLDCCSYRLDAWKTGLVATRLDEMRHRTPEGKPTEAVSKGLYVGAYGWLENVKPEHKQVHPATIPPDLEKIFVQPGQDLPVIDASNAGYIHAPSLNHAATAAVLKNAYLVNASQAKPDLMAVNLSSERVRQALSLLEGLRNGQSLEALLGYRFERGLHDAHHVAGVEADKFIYPLRQKFPLVADKLKQTKSDGQTEIGLLQANNVIDGVRLLNHIRNTGASTYPFGVAVGTAPGQLPSANADEQAVINAQVDAIQNLNDAVADLLLAESVYQVVTGNFERSAANAQAMAKGRYPAEQEVAITPRNGHAITQRVALHLDATADPNASPSATPMTPRASAEAPLNRWLAGQLPAPADVVCRVSYRVLATEQQIVVSQQDLGLQPIDLLYVLNLELEQAMTELDGRIIHYLRYNAGLDTHPGMSIEIRYTEPEPGKVTFFELAPLIKSLRALLLKSRYVAPTDMFLPLQAEASSPAYDLPELHSRITGAINGLTSLAQQLATLATLAADPSDLDAYALATSQLFLQTALYGVPQTGVGDIYETMRSIYHAILAKVQELTSRWQEKQATFTALLATWPTLTADEQRFALLLKAEGLIAASPTTTLPATPDLYKTTVEATKATFDTRLAAFESLLTTGTEQLVDLIAEVATLAPAVDTHDSVPLDIAEQQQAATTLRAELTARVVSVQADVAARIASAEAELNAAVAISQPEEQARAYVQAARHVLGDDFKLLPRFSLPETQGLELQNCWADTGNLTTYLQKDRGRLFPVDDWLYGVARVRDKLFHWENMLLLGEAFGRPAPELTPLQLPYRPDDQWLALEFPADYAFDDDRLLYTAHFAQPFDRTAAQCGLLLDEWTEVIPAREQVTGLTFHFDRPNSEPPQVMLLATPPELTGAWQWDDLVAMLHETLDAAQKRAVEPSQIDGTSYAQFLPATLMAVTLYQITIATNLAFNIDLYKKIG